MGERLRIYKKRCATTSQPPSEQLELWASREDSRTGKTVWNKGGFGARGAEPSAQWCGKAPPYAARRRPVRSTFASLGFVVANLTRRSCTLSVSANVARGDHSRTASTEPNEHVCEQLFAVTAKGSWRWCMQVSISGLAKSLGDPVAAWHPTASVVLNTNGPPQVLPRLAGLFASAPASQ